MVAGNYNLAIVCFGTVALVNFWVFKPTLNKAALGNMICFEWSTSIEGASGETLVCIRGESDDKMT